MLDIQEMRDYFQTLAVEQFTPLYDKLMVHLIPPEEMRGHIIIPTAAQHRINAGIVIAKGEGAVQPDGTLRELFCEVGDIVIFEKYGGSEMDINDKNLAILKEREVHVFHRPNYMLAEKENTP